MHLHPLGRLVVVLIVIVHCCLMVATRSTVAIMRRTTSTSSLFAPCFLRHVARQEGVSSWIPSQRNMLGPSNRRALHGTTALGLNRLLFEPEEVTDVNGSDCVAVLPAEDPRAVHVRKILGNKDGDTLRVGVLDAGRNDNAVMGWLSDKSLRINMGPSDTIRRPVTERPRVDLLLAMQAPLRLERMVPVIASLGVDRLLITGGSKVVTSYWGTHLIRRPDVLRELLVEGLTAAGETAVPRVSFHRRLKVFLEDDFPVLYPPDSPTIRAIAHPFRLDPTPDQLVSNYDTRIRDLPPPPPALLQQPGRRARLVLAVGPESGWAEPYELEMFKSFGFQQVSMGPRVLRTETAVPALLALAHDQLHAIDRSGGMHPPAA